MTKQLWHILDSRAVVVASVPGTRGDAMREMHALKNEKSRNGSKRGWRIIEDKQVARPK